MSLTTDTQAHADTLFSVASAAVSGAIIAEPNHYSKNELGRRLVDRIHKAIDLAALVENFSDLDQ